MFLTVSDLRATDFFFFNGQDIFSVFCPQGLGQLTDYDIVGNLKREFTKQVFDKL